MTRQSEPPDAVQGRADGLGLVAVGRPHRDPGGGDRDARHRSFVI